MYSHSKSNILVQRFSKSDPWTVSISITENLLEMQFTFNLWNQNLMAEAISEFNEIFQYILKFENSCISGPGVH